MGLLNPDFSLPKLFLWEKVRRVVQIWKATQLDTEGANSASDSKMGTYSLKQWAADTSHVLLMSVAPQRWMLLYCKLACHGQSPVSAEDNPPTIRSDDDFAIDLTDLFCRNPQTVRKDKESISYSSV